MSFKKSQKLLRCLAIPLGTLCKKTFIYFLVADHDAYRDDIRELKKLDQNILYDVLKDERLYHHVDLDDETKKFLTKYSKGRMFKSSKFCQIVGIRVIDIKFRLNRYLAELQTFLSDRNFFMCSSKRLVVVCLFYTEFHAPFDSLIFLTNSTFDKRQFFYPFALSLAIKNQSFTRLWSFTHENFCRTYTFL